MHGAVHSARVGLKYTWFGAGYISNMYYKWIANYATYDFNQGGDLAFSKGNAVRLYAKGDNEGKPRNQTGANVKKLDTWSLNYTLPRKSLCGQVSQFY